MSVVCLRKYVSGNLLVKKLSRRQYLREKKKKKAKMYVIEGRFWSEVAEHFVSQFDWPTTHQAFVGGKTPLQRPYSAPTRTGETGQAPLFVQKHRSDERAED